MARPQSLRVGNTLVAIPPWVARRGLLRGARLVSCAATLYIPRHLFGLILAVRLWVSGGIRRLRCFGMVGLGALCELWSGRLGAAFAVVLWAIVMCSVSNGAVCKSVDAVVVVSIPVDAYGRVACS